MNLRKLLTDLAEFTGFSMITAGTWTTFGTGPGLVVGGASLIVISVVNA
jgi:hypothetical protein